MREVRPQADLETQRAAVESGESPVPLRRLWLGVALAPAAWVVAELWGYYLAARSCEPGRSGVPLLGTSHPNITHVVFETALALVAAVGLATALGNWRTTRQFDERTTLPAPGRALFMSFTGLLISAVFLFGILLFEFSGFVVDACSQAR